MNLWPRRITDVTVCFVITVTIAFMPHFIQPAASAPVPPAPIAARLPSVLPLNIPVRAVPNLAGTPVAPVAAGLSGAGADLIIQSISVTPPNPAPDQPATITVVVKNNGGSALSAGFYTRLYIDPAQPPITTTLDTSYTGWFLGLAAGATFTWSYTNYVFGSAGCNHTIYAWVDPENTVVEDDETNNLATQSLCVGTTTDPPDSYEPDDSCAVARPLTINAPGQTHTFTPVNDQDWYRFDGIGGRTYTITANNIGANVNATLSPYNSCSAPPSFGGGNQLEITLPTSGVYYLKTVNQNQAATTATTYTIAITSDVQADCSGFSEPNNSLATAGDLVPGAAAQPHSFCDQSDEDWVKFPVQAGAVYTVQATSTGGGATPSLAGFASADAAPLTGNPFQFTAAANDTYYTRVTNAISTTYGVSVTYGLAVTTQTCVSDTFEPDNSRDTAHAIPVDGSGQPHVACPAGDRDWTSFSATAGVTYTLETIPLGAVSDTVLCLFDNVGTQIACDDESGANHGSRLSWHATAAGTYFIETRQADERAAGPDTRYELSVASGSCKSDLYEPDNTADTASLLPSDGSRQSRSFCPSGDTDWARLSIPSAGSYTVETSGLGQGSDTLLNLYGPDRTTLIASNDDYGPGLGSRLVYTFTQPGTYMVEVRHFNPARYGRSTNYILSATAGAPPTTPTPDPGTASPTPTATTTPPPSGIQTVVITNRERLTTLYGTTRTTQLFDKLALFTNHASVQGELIAVDGNATVSQAYTAWAADQTNVALANRAAGAVRSVIMEYLAAHPSVQYIVIVGDDRVVPSRRVKDRTSQPESNYAPAVGASTVGAALQDDNFLTDDFYADREPDTWQGAELYLPDLGIGRLIETPEQIGGMLDMFLTSDSLTLNRALVVGYDFVQDVASNICDLIGQDVGTAGLDCTLIGNNWSGATFNSKQLGANPLFKFQSINGHASHASQGAPAGPQVTAAQIAASTGDLSGAVIFSVGCHAGLNVPENATSPVDLAEAFAAKQVNYVGNTGFGWGSTMGVRFSEKLLQNYAQELLKGGSTNIGTALMRAKRRYYQELDGLEERDEKVVQQVVLYGFPMYRLSTGAVLGNDVPFPSVAVSTNFGALATGPGLAQAAGKGSLHLSVATPGPSTAAAAGYQQVTTNWGSYFQLDGHTSTTLSGPIQPQVYLPVQPPAGQRLRGAVFTGGAYTSVPMANPVQDRPLNEYVGAGDEPPLPTGEIFPPIPFVLHTINTAERSDSTLAMVMGQYDATTGQQRLYSDAGYDLYYSTSLDESGPTVTSVDGYYNLLTAQATFKVEATDPSTVTRVLIAYAPGGGTWSSVDLHYNAATQKWAGSVSGVRGASYFVQAVDQAGNATAISRKGGYFRLEEISLAAQQPRRLVYLPFITR